jgi:polysaccharide export outer membrane protein
MRLLGEVHIDGMTVKEIAAKLTTLLKEYYEDPKVQVRVASYASKKIYVFGQVGGGASVGSTGTSGGRAVPYTGRNTLLDTLADAGMNIIAWRSQIKVIRADPDKHKRHVINVDIDRMVERGDTSMNLLLEPGDIVYVPPTPLGWVGLRVQELMFPFSPILNGYTMPATMINANDVYDRKRND